MKNLFEVSRGERLTIKINGLRLRIERIAIFTLIVGILLILGIEGIPNTEFQKIFMQVISGTLLVLPSISCIMHDIIYRENKIRHHQ